MSSLLIQQLSLFEGGGITGPDVSVDLAREAKKVFIYLVICLFVRFIFCLLVCLIVTIHGRFVFFGKFGWIHLSKSLFVCIHTYMCACMFLYVFLYVCMYLFMYVCT